MNKFVVDAKRNIIKNIKISDDSFRRKGNKYISSDNSIIKEVSFYRSKYDEKNELSLRVEWFVYVDTSKHNVKSIMQSKQKIIIVLYGTLPKIDNEQNTDFYHLDSFDPNAEEIIKNVALDISEKINKILLPFFMKINDIEDIYNILISNDDNMPDFLSCEPKSTRIIHAANLLYMMQGPKFAKNLLEKEIFKIEHDSGLSEWSRNKNLESLKEALKDY
jgi:hypothetical protein